MLEPILQQLSAGNPQVAQLIGQNPDQFLQLLSEDADGDAPLPPGAQEISVTEEERAAIERVRTRAPFPHLGPCFEDALCFWSGCYTTTVTISHERLTSFVMFTTVVSFGLRARHGHPGIFCM